ncbi:AAA family ATPase CDC48 subfamily protein (macronuclear) [Tetrahymena thermophila SB210]|uniref:AAA family ATPase CDC48 subfamily protein n=1 Tax=Tetrahymena thermophila (strain SB210) TaxID=312017 RepID=Q22V55_TETTS|nr:AAA family ATPase CDC48 subfamily protein [Tetrahymena thermophila SB210]EAR89093.2 AAA family ATPase CDC48 subfamily protein [Tetrahymena thermophila SB210]|eukprot:XP_001009338.2 AAA family ATPase CDC48 subfamily protein [Tetrahymena thermophila SB210]
MSSKQQKKTGTSKSKKDENEASIQEQPIDSSIQQAAMLTISPLSDDLSLNKLHHSLVLNYFREMSLNQVVSLGSVLTFSIYGKKHSFRVVHIVSASQQNSQQNQSSEAKQQQESKEIQENKFLITKKTTFKLAELQETQNENEESKEQLQAQQSVQQELILLAGVSKQQEELENYLKLSLFQYEGFKDLGFSPVKGILLSGPSGTGKTQMIKKMSQKMNEVKFVLVETKQFLSRLVGEGEKKVEQYFNLSKRSGEPTVLFFDDIHIICDKSNKGLVSTLINEIDKLKQTDRVVVVCATSQIKKIDENLKRAGRLDKEINFEVPKVQERCDILNCYLERTKHNLNQDDILEINLQMNGFTGADVVSLLRETLLERVKEQKEIIEKNHFENALQNVHASGVKDILMEIPKVYWRDIGGYLEVKDQIKQVIEWPLKHPDAFKRMGIQPSKGILLYGPPGCSKTMIAKAIATESKLNFLAVKGPELFSKYVGDSEKAIREVFRRARLCAPSVIFFDEIDAIATQRSVNTDVSERVLIQMLTEMDGFEGLKNVVIVAATNRPEIIDKALTRPGRFDHLIYVPPPDIDCRREILKINILGNKMPVKEGDLDIEELSKMTDGYSGAEITLIVREAGLHALTRDIYQAQVTKEDFINAISKVKPRITLEMLQKYKNFANNLKFF